MSYKIGRNDPCYCGSGIKYKKCCMKIYKNIVSSPDSVFIDKDIIDAIQQKCIAEHGDNEHAAKQFWNELVTAVYERDPASVITMIEAQPEEDNKEYMTQIYKELSCSKD